MQLPNIICELCAISWLHNLYVIRERCFVGSTSRSFKRRYYEHKISFPNDVKIVKPRNCTELANYIWKLHNEGNQKGLQSCFTKVASNHLKFCKRCFVIFPKCRFFSSWKLKSRFFYKKPKVGICSLTLFLSCLDVRSI